MRIRSALIVLLLLGAGCARAAEIESTPLPVTPERAFPALRFRRPIVVTHAGDGSDRVFIASQLGTLHVLPNDQEAKDSKVFLDIEDLVDYQDKENEKGLLGLAFHPQYKENGEFFVYYMTTREPLTAVISRFRVSKDDPDRADPDSEEVLMTLKQPFWNHNGGTIAFGPDGYLYVGLGDGGAGGDPQGNGQNLSTLLGSILRIDVDSKAEGLNYGIPKDNPFVETPNARPEIWAYGIRNVWRIAFDRETDTLWAADVGQDLWEEINLIVRGGNYGWNLREGKHPFGPNGAPASEKLIDPIWEYSHMVGRSITGGFVYRGDRVPELVGKYLYADYVTGQLYAMEYDEAEKKVVGNYTIAGNVLPVMSFGEDQAGDAYFTTDRGEIFRFRGKSK